MTYGFSFVEGSLAWRFPIAFQLVFSIILISTIPWLPESPRWLLAHGFEEEGIDVLVALEGAHASAKDEYILTQRDEILEAVRIERESAPNWRDILRGNTGDTGMMRRLILGAGMWLPRFHFDRHALTPRSRYPMDATAGRNQRNKLLVSPTFQRSFPGAHFVSFQPSSCPPKLCWPLKQSVSLARCMQFRFLPHILLLRPPAHRNGWS